MDIHQEEMEEEDVGFEVTKRVEIFDEEEEDRASRARQALDTMFQHVGATKKTADDKEDEKRKTTT